MKIKTIKTMNYIEKRATMVRLAQTIELQKLTNKAEIARVLGIKAPYLSMMLNTEYTNKCPNWAWEVVRNWLNSDYTLSQYRQHKEKYPVTVEPKSGVKKELVNIDMIKSKPIKYTHFNQLSVFSDQELCDELHSRGYSGTIEIKKSITI